MSLRSQPDFFLLTGLLGVSWWNSCFAGAELDVGRYNPRLWFSRESTYTDQTHRGQIDKSEQASALTYSSFCLPVVSPFTCSVTQLLVAPGVPWLAAASLQSLPLLSRGLLLCPRVSSHEDTSRTGLRAYLTPV